MAVPLTRRPLVTAAALVAALSIAPYIRASLAPPPGHSFVGAFLFIEDTYNYLGYVRQAQEGAWVFRSRLTAEPHQPALVNLEWWAAGVLSRALGGWPMLAWRLLGLVAAVAFVALADAWLRRAGLPPTHRLPALLLVCGGAGLGGLLSLLGLVRATPLDLSTGLFPVMELLTNPHFVIGTALAMGALLALSHGSGRGTAAGLALGVAAGLTRPYDLALVIAARAAAVALTEPPRRWLARTVPLAALAPVLAYDYWVIHHDPAYAGFLALRFPPPPLVQVLVALGPAAALAALSLRGEEEPARDARTARAHLWAWAAVGLVLIAARPVPYALQFLAGIGLPLLVLGALGLARWRPWATVAVLAVLANTPLVALARMSADDARWFVPTERLEAAGALGAACRGGELAMAPADIGLYALARSSCVPFVSHPVMAGYEERLAQALAFYGPWDTQQRLAFLDQECVPVALLPAAGAYEVHRRPVPCARGRPLGGLGGEAAQRR